MFQKVANFGKVTLGKRSVESEVLGKGGLVSVFLWTLSIQSLYFVGD